MNQLARLAVPIAEKYIQQKPGKSAADYVEHAIIEQYLIGILGRVPHTRLLREIYDGETLTGVVMQMTVWIDGEETIVEEAGAGSNPQDTTNGDRLKSSTSDAYKRCAMRLSCSLHLWASHYFLDKSLAKEAPVAN